MKAPEGTRQLCRKGCGGSPRPPGSMSVLASLRSEAEALRRNFSHIALHEQAGLVPEMRIVSRMLRGRYFIGRRMICTPGAVDPHRAAAGRVTVLSRQYTFPMNAFMESVLIWQAQNTAAPAGPHSKSWQLRHWVENSTVVNVVNGWLTPMREDCRGRRNESLCRIYMDT